MTTQSPAGPGGYLVKDFADGWYWTPNAALDHASGALVWSVADGRYETDPPVILIVAEEPQAAEDVHRTMDGETVGGFRVAAWRYIGPQDPDDARYGYRYCEHWSSVGNVPKKVERLFTEEQLRAAMLSAAPAPEGGAVMRAEDAPVWADGIVTDGERVSMAQKAEADHGGTYWAVDGGDGGLDWEPTHFVSLSALATREEAPAEAGEIDLYDDKVQAGIAWTMRQWGETLGLKTWTMGDGSESVEGDVGAEIHTILVDAGLRDPETNEMAALRAQPQAREDAQPVAIVPPHCTGASLAFEPMVATHCYDKHGIPIERGDIVKVFHFTGARRKRHYMFKQCLGLSRYPSSPEGWRKVFFSHLNFCEIGDRNGPYHEEPGAVLTDYEVVQSIKCDHETRPKALSAAPGEVE